MPDFPTLEEADAWRSVNAPPKASNLSANQAAPAGQKIADSFPNTTAGDGGGAAAGTGENPSAQRSPANTAAGTLEPFPAAPPAPPPGGERLDVRQFVKAGADFEALMIAQAEEVPQIAHGLFVLACQRGNAAEISAANRNWHETAKSAHAVRADFIELQEKTRALISIDDVEDVLGTELQAARAGFLKLGERIAAKANPADPLLAQTVIDAAVDEVFRKLDAALARGERELVQPKAS